MKSPLRYVCAVAALVCFAIISFATPRATEAAIPIAESEEGPQLLELSGYVRSTSGVHQLDYGEAYLTQTRGVNAAVGRLQWLAILSSNLELKVHQELLWSASTAAADASGGGSAVFGIGASRATEPTLDLQTAIVDESGVRLTHDVDRLALDIYTEGADFTVGRQAITWGKSLIFPVADLWSRLSPFDLDTFQKPGIDAVRALVYPSISSEIDFVVADRGSLEDLSGGVRGATTVGPADVWLAAGKFWRDVSAMGGGEVVFERVKLRAEAVLPWNIDRTELDLPRATGGVEWYGIDFTLGAEYHFNGIGMDDPEEYVDQLATEEYGRGESYFLGRHYAGLFGSYSGFPDLEMTLSTIGNLLDPSLIVTPIVRYQIAQNTLLGVGSFVTVGETPKLTPLPRFRSEFGAYGNFYFLELTAHY